MLRQPNDPHHVPKCHHENDGEGEDSIDQQARGKLGGNMPKESPRIKKGRQEIDADIFNIAHFDIS